MVLEINDICLDYLKSSKKYKYNEQNIKSLVEHAIYFYSEAMDGIVPDDVFKQVLRYRGKRAKKGCLSIVLP